MSLVWSAVRVSLCVGVVIACAAAQQPTPSSTPNQQTQTSTSTGQPGVFTGHLTGAGMDGATVTLTNSATGESRTATTDRDGAFTFNDLRPGSYRVSVKLASGLQLGESSIQIMQSGGNQVEVQFESTAGAPRGKLELEGRAPTLETDSAEVSRSYDSQFVRSLPLMDRQHQELVTLMPGVTPPVLSTDRIHDPHRSRTFNVNGLPAYANLYNQDGVYANEPFNARPLRIAPEEAVQALEVRTSNYNAEYGLSGGAWSSTVTRPGTNAVHGSLFAFNTNSYLRSGQTYDQTLHAPRSNVNQFGGSAGGPIINDKLFWFLSYEGLLQRGGQEALATVPTAAMRMGDFSGIPGATIYSPFSGAANGTGRSPFMGNMIPGAQINPTSQQILNSMPLPNAPGMYNNLVGNVPMLDDNHRADGKIDHRFSEKSTGYFRYGYTRGNADQGTLLGLAGAPLESDFRAMTAAASWSQIVSKNVLGEFRLGYDRYRNQVTPWGNGTAFGGQLTGFANGLPSINISGFSPIGYGGDVPRREVDNVYEAATNWVFHTGMHTIKAGVSARELQSNGFTNGALGSLGSFTFGPGGTLGNTSDAAGINPAVLQANAFAAFLTGAPSVAGISNFTTTPAYRQRQYGAYITDTINLYQHLFLEVGVRYDAFMPIEPGQPGGAVYFDPATNTTGGYGQNGVNSRMYRTDTNNVAPRVGLAFQPMNRLVFRAGYGIHYFPVPFALAGFNPAMMGAQSGVGGGLGVTTFTNPMVPAAGGAMAANLPYTIGSRTVPTPYVQTFSGMIQGDLGAGFLLDIGYVGNLGRELPYNVGLVGMPGSGLSAFTGDRTALTTEMGYGLNSNYNSGQVNLTKKFAYGLAISGAYTYSKALDYGSNLLDPYSRQSNYGPADWDRTHILSVSHVWRLPFGPGTTRFETGWAGRLLGDWELTGVLRWATGTPYTVTVDPIACACLGVGAVPAAFGGGTSQAVNGAASFDPNIFSSPGANTFGGLNRNVFRGPDLFQYNAALFRNFAVNENIKLELRGEVYNVTNTSNPGNPVASATSAGFGTMTGNLNGLAGRQFQVAARLLF